MALAEHGPLVSFNVTEYRSDAFLVTKTGISDMPLPKLNFDDLAHNAVQLVGKDRISTGRRSTKPERQKRLQSLLSWLWNVAVEPVLNRLGLLTQPRSLVQLPRIWWVTSGLMGLNFHPTDELPPSKIRFKDICIQCCTHQNYFEILPSLDHITEEYQQEICV